MQGEIGETSRRTILCTDAVSWLMNNNDDFEGSVFCGIPDIQDINLFAKKTQGILCRAKEYETWFVNVIQAIFRRIRKGQCAIFSQTDFKVIDEEGMVAYWMDKSYLCSKIAETYGFTLLWHKIALGSDIGSTSYRPSFTHLLCYGNNVPFHSSMFQTPDVIERGHMTWPKATGLEACILAVAFLKHVVNTQLIINPFCGHGTIVAVANYFGISSLGIEISPKRARSSQAKTVAPFISLMSSERLQALGVKQGQGQGQGQGHVLVEDGGDWGGADLAGKDQLVPSPPSPGRGAPTATAIPMLVLAPCVEQVEVQAKATDACDSDDGEDGSDLDYLSTLLSTLISDGS